MDLYQKNMQNTQNTLN